MKEENANNLFKVAAVAAYDTEGLIQASETHFPKYSWEYWSIGDQEQWEDNSNAIEGRTLQVNDRDFCYNKNQVPDSVSTKQK